MKSFCFFFLVFCSLAVSAQQKTIKLITAEKLEKRISNPDTVFIVNFWATWCGPCVKELPLFDQLQKANAKQPLKVLLVSMDFKSKLESAVIPFAQKHQLTSEIFLADITNDQEFFNRIDKSWSGALPGTLVINNKKKLHKFYEQGLTASELSKIYQDAK